MKDEINTFFSETDFDVKSPRNGHLERFQNKLNQQKKTKTISWKWMSVAASIVLCLGFWLGTNYNQKQIDLADVSPKMEEVQSYFIATIHQELKKVESRRNLETEAVIEQALDELEELEEVYQSFVKNLSKKENQQITISGMIGNYQQRLEILENLLYQIQIINNPINPKNEEFI